MPELNASLIPKEVERLEGRCKPVDGVDAKDANWMLIEAYLASAAISVPPHAPAVSVIGEKDADGELVRVWKLTLAQCKEDASRILTLERNFPETDRLRNAYRDVAVGAFGRWEAIYLQHLDDPGADSEWARTRRTNSELLRSGSPHRREWEALKGRYDPRYVAAMEELIANPVLPPGWTHDPRGAPTE